MIIAGPGFSRRVIANQYVGADRLVDLGRIEVDPGHKVRGRVTDAHGFPLPGVDVTILETPLAISTPVGDDVLGSFARGNYVSTTDSDGYYLIEGVSRSDLLGGHPTISSVVDGKVASGPRPVPNADVTIDLVLLPVGVIDGSVVGADQDTMESGVLVRSTSNADVSLVAIVSDNGTFHLENVPEAEYDVVLMGSRSPAQRVVVVHGQPAWVTLSTP
jgi:hypothetical protein